MRTRGPVTIAIGVGVALALITATACGGGSSPSGTASAPTTAPPPSSSSSATQAAAAGSVGDTNPCSLLSTADVQQLDPALGAGKVATVGKNKICDWPDAHGIPAVQLQVVIPPSGSLKDDLKTNLAPSGYDVVDLSGIGDEAAAAFQQADASKGLTAGLAEIEARAGDRVVGITTPGLSITQDSAQFETVKQLLSKALAAAQ